VCLNFYFLCRVERNLLQINKKIFRLFLKKNEKERRKFFLKIKRIETKNKRKNYFLEICAKKGHNKTGCAKVVVPWSCVTCDILQERKKFRYRKTKLDNLVFNFGFLPLLALLGGVGTAGHCIGRLNFQDQLHVFRNAWRP